MDDSTVVATRTTPDYQSPPLAPGSDWTFHIRAYDTVNGLEEQNISVRIRVIVDSLGHDATGIPPAPTGLSASPGPGGVLVVGWHHRVATGAPKPTGFHIYIWLSSGAPSYVTPALTVAYTGAATYSATTGALADAIPVNVAVRAYNAAGEEGNTVSVPALPDATPPTVPISIGSMIVP